MRLFLAVALLAAACGCMKKKPAYEPGVTQWQPVALPIPPGYQNVIIKVLGGSGPADIWAFAYAEKSDEPRRRNALSFHFDGHAWSLATVPARATSSLIAFAPNDAWAVGTYGTVAHWDGQAWTELKIDGIDYDLNQVVGWPGDLWVAIAGRELVHYDGQRWQLVKRPELDGMAGVYDLLALPNGDLLVPRQSTKDTPSLLRRSKTDAWTVQPVGPGGIFHMAASGWRDIWAFSATDSAYHFDGFAWSKFATPPLRVNAAYATSASEAYMVGDEGMIARWDGAAWKPSGSGTTARMWCVYAPPGMQPLAGGEAGLLQMR